MTAALATLAFLVTMWLIVQLAAQMAEESGAKMLAALKGRSLLATQPTVVPVQVRVSARSKAQRPLRARAQLRAAA